MWDLAGVHWQTSVRSFQSKTSSWFSRQVVLYDKRNRHSMLSRFTFCFPPPILCIRNPLECKYRRARAQRLTQLEEVAAVEPRRQGAAPRLTFKVGSWRKQGWKALASGCIHKRKQALTARAHCKREQTRTAIAIGKKRKRFFQTPVTLEDGSWRPRKSTQRSCYWRTSEAEASPVNKNFLAPSWSVSSFCFS